MICQCLLRNFIVKKICKEKQLEFETCYKLNLESFCNALKISLVPTLFLRLNECLNSIHNINE